MVAVLGEAGVGKSRLVYEFVHAHHTQGWRVLESASVSYGKATPYFPIIDLLKRYAHIEDHDDPAQRCQRTLTALTRLLLCESQVQPLLLVFEDLHWIDSETQALLDRLVESLPTAHLLLLVNYRPEYQHGWPALSWPPPSTCTAHWT